MKASALINSFRSGLMGLFMRSRSDVKEVTNACEVLDNFHVKPTGGADRRLGLELRDFPTKDVTGLVKSYRLDTTPSQSFIFNIEGEDFYFIFDTSVGFTSTDFRTVTTDKLPILDSTSNFLRIFDMSGKEYKVKTFGSPWEFGNGYPYGYFNGYYPTDFTLLPDYLDNRSRAVDRFNFTKLTAKTVIFCDSNGKFFPFYVTRDTIPYTSGGANGGTKNFILAPWFVQYSMLQDVMNPATATYYVPISPLTYPYSTANTNNSYKVFVNNLYGGVDPADGTRYVVGGNPHTQNWVKKIGIPRDLIDYNTTTNPPLGMMIRITSTVGKEGTFLVLGYHSINATHVFFYAMSTVFGGAYDAAGTSFFQLSAWGDQVGFPTCVNVHRNLMTFANAGNDRNRFWFAGVSSQNARNFQGMMQTVLLQDVTTDVSGLKYYDNTLKPDRGFDIGLGEGRTGEIKWLYSRRNMHIGTDDGEHQVNFLKGYPSGVAGEYNIIKVGSNKSVNVQPVEGDRKIFYVSEGGYKIRIISTENKDYDSLDTELTNYIELDFPVVKLAWCEKLRSLLVLTTYGLYSFTVDQLNDSLAPSTLNTALYGAPLVIDIMCNQDSYKIVLHDSSSGRRYVLESYSKNHYNLGNTIYPRNIFLDFSKSFTNLVSTPTGLGNYFEQFRNKTMFMYKNSEATGTSFVVPIGYNAGDALTFLPAFIETDECSFGLKYLSDLVTFPVEEGSKYGSPIGDIKRIDRATVMLYKSGKCQAGNPDSAIYDVETMSNTAYKTDNVKVDFPDSPDTIARVQIKTDEPVPLTILGVSVRMVDYTGE